MPTVAIHAYCKSANYMYLFAMLNGITILICGHNLCKEKVDLQNVIKEIITK